MAFIRANHDQSLLEKDLTHMSVVIVCHCAMCLSSCALAWAKKEVFVVSKEEKKDSLNRAEPTTNNELGVPEST